MEQNPRDSYITQTQLSNIIDTNSIIHSSLNEELQEPIDIIKDIDINKNDKFPASASKIDLSKTFLTETNFINTPLESKIFKAKDIDISSIESYLTKIYNSNSKLLKPIKDKQN